MTDTNSSPNNKGFLAMLTVKIVGFFGSWLSVLIHTVIFSSWFILGFDLEVLLVIVSLEAIYIGILILMAENVETIEREQINELKRQSDLKIIKHDTQLDELTRREIKQLNKQLNTLHNLIAEKFSEDKGDV